MYNAQTYGACSVHTGTTIYPVAGRPYETILFFSSTDTSTRPRRLTRAPSRFNDGASESESDSDLSDAVVDDELHSNGDASEDEEEAGMQPWLPLLRRQQVLFGLFSLNRSMINSYANIHHFISANYKSP